MLKNILGTFQAVTAFFFFAAFSLQAFAASPTFINGSFEENQFDPNGTYNVGGTARLNGWTAFVRDPYPWGIPNANTVGAGPTPYGNQWVVIGYYGTGGTWIQQTVSGFTTGEIYTLNFALASEESFAPGATVLVSFPSGSNTASEIFTAPSTGALRWNTWATYSKKFLATSTSVTFRFSGLAGPGADIGLDAVSISPGPTPTPSPSATPSYTLTLSLDHSEVYPSGVLGPYGDVQEDPLKSTARVFAKLTDNQGSGVAAKTIRYSSSAVELSGGHDHSGNRPTGAFYSADGFTNSIQCITGPDGTCSVDYLSSEVGGTERISASVLEFPSLAQTIDLTIQIPALGELPAGDLYNLSGATDYHSFEHNHFGTAKTRDAVSKMTLEFFNAFGKKLGINDMSLPSGGLFDIEGNWQTPHLSHRRGASADIDRCVKLDEGEELGDYTPCTHLKTRQIIPGYGQVSRRIMSDLCKAHNGYLVPEATYHCEFK